MKKYSLQFLSIFMFSLSCFFSCSNASGSGFSTDDSDFGIKYSFFLSNTSDQPWASVSGLEGSIVPTVISPAKPGYRFTGWKTKSGDSIPVVFGKDKLSFYARWVDINTVNLIGSKPYPDTVGDVIFTDGSASPYPEDWSNLKTFPWDKAVAMLITTTYNPANGQNVKGGQYQYKIAAGLVVAKGKEWCVDKLTDGRQADTYALEKNVARYTSLYLGYSWSDISYITGNPLPPLSLNSYFGKQHLVDSSAFKLYATSSVTPAFEYVIQYGKNQNINVDFKYDWYMPSSAEMTVLLTNPELKQRYNRLLNKKYSILTDADKETKFISDVNTNFWTSNTYTGQESSEKIYLGYTDKNNAKEVVYGFITSTLERAKTKYQVWLFDPYTGKDEKPYIAASSEYGWFGSDSSKPDGVNKIANYHTQDETNVKTRQQNVVEYAHRYVVYTDAYMIDSNGATYLKNKKTKYAVIPMRAFY